ncbi:hypothetical protein HDV03_001958 [Kappamyces sp. JEL0829]|nr:hypothetical protein HDV03_001958 [Kappamyces sp. JEL0829]
MADTGTLTPISTIAIVTCSVAAFTSGVFITQACFYFKLSDFKLRKWASILIVLQLLMGFADHLAIAIQYAVPGIDCSFLGHFSFLLFPIWVTMIEGILLLKAKPFSDYPAYLVYWICFLWASRWCTELYTVAKIYTITQPWDYCTFLTDFSLSSSNLSIRIVTEISLLIPFLSRMWELNKSRNKFFWMSVHNAIATMGLIIVEIVLYYAVSSSALLQYLNLIFCLADCAEAWIVIFLIEDTKQTLKTLRSTPFDVPKSKTRAPKAHVPAMSMDVGGTKLSKSKVTEERVPSPQAGFLMASFGEKDTVEVE